jgi:phage shock protein C
MDAMNNRTAQRTRRRLTLDRSRSLVGGVCAGLARYLNVEVDWIRIGAVVTAIFFTKIVVGVYLVAWLVLDEE